MCIDKKILENAMERLRAGDKHALGEVYATMKKSVYLLSFSILKNSSAAEDIVQETFIRVADNIDKYKSGAGASTWICVIARNLSYRAYTNSKKVAKVSDFDDLIFVSLENGDTAWTEKIELKEAMLLLEPHELEIVTLFSEGYKHREIASVVEKPEGTVRWLFHESVKKLRDRLKR